jgi:hypothetical protein
MSYQPVFAGLIIDELDNPVEVAYIGAEACYVVNDAGFRRHIPCEQVDRQVLEMMGKIITQHGEAITDQTAKMLGQDDPFSRAMIESQLKNIDQKFNDLMNIGLPEEVRAYMGMMGFRIRINLHGEVIEVEQPGTIAPEDE